MKPLVQSPSWKRGNTVETPRSRHQLCHLLLIVRSCFNVFHISLKAEVMALRIQIFKKVQFWGGVTFFYLIYEYCTYTISTFPLLPSNPSMPPHLAPSHICSSFSLIVIEMIVLSCLHEDVFRPGQLRLDNLLGDSLWKTLNPPPLDALNCL